MLSHTWSKNIVDRSNRWTFVEINCIKLTNVWFHGPNKLSLSCCLAKNMIETCMELNKGTKIEDHNWSLPNSVRFLFPHLINQFVIVWKWTLINGCVLRDTADCSMTVFKALAMAPFWIREAIEATPPATASNCCSDCCNCSKVCLYSSRTDRLSLVIIGNTGNRHPSECRNMDQDFTRSICRITAGT